MKVCLNLTPELIRFLDKEQLQEALLQVLEKPIPTYPELNSYQPTNKESVSQAVIPKDSAASQNGNYTHDEEITTTIEVTKPIPPTPTPKLPPTNTRPNALDEGIVQEIARRYKNGEILKQLCIEYNQIYSGIYTRLSRTGVITQKKK